MIQNISKLFNLNNKYKTEEHTIPDNLRSKELEWKLALLVRNVDSVEDIDMQFVKKTKINKGTKQDLYTSYRLDFDIREKLNEILSKHTGNDVNKISEDTERDNFMTAEEAKQYGIIDNILTNRVDMKKD